MPNIYKISFIDFVTSVLEIDNSNEIIVYNTSVIPFDKNFVGLNIEDAIRQATIYMNGLTANSRVSITGLPFLRTRTIQKVYGLYGFKANGGTLTSFRQQIGMKNIVKIN